MRAYERHANGTPGMERDSRAFAIHDQRIGVGRGERGTRFLQRHPGHRAGVYIAPTGELIANPTSLAAATHTVYLELLGTGIPAAGMANVHVTANRVNAPVTHASAQDTYIGVDQVQVQLPFSLAGKGNVYVQLTASGVAANAVQVTIQ